MGGQRRWLLRGILALAILASYPAFVLGYTWTHVFQCELPGGRHGPLDAYRHTLASAVLSYTLGPRAVALTTTVMEFRNKPSSYMDRHNNRIGAEIGANAASFSLIEPTVRAHISMGAVNTDDAQQTTWLPPAAWREGRFW